MSDHIERECPTCRSYICSGCAPAPAESNPMTPDKTPTDAQLQSAYDSVPAHGNQQDVHIAGLRAVLAKWGSPAPVGVEPVTADSVLAVDEREQERIAFKDAHRHLELDEVPDAWGRPMFKHSHVEASWLGWIARAAHAPADSVLEEAARHYFGAGWKACANFCDRDDVRFDGIVGHRGCPQFEEAFRAARKQGGSHD